jgi:hypothetical protein
MVQVRLGKSLRIVDLALLGSRSFHVLLDYIRGDDIDLGEIGGLIKKVNEGLKGERLKHTDSEGNASG